MRCIEILIPRMEETGCRIAYLLYDRFTALDITGPHEVLNPCPATSRSSSPRPTGPVATSPTPSRWSPTLDRRGAKPGRLVVPGGFGTRALLEHEPLLDWMREVHESTTWTTSVCTGSLLLRRRRPPRRRAGHHPLARARPARRAGRPSRARANRRARQDRHRRRRLGGDRHGPPPGPADQRRRGAQAVQLGIEYDPSRPSTPALREGPARADRRAGHRRVRRADRRPSRPSTHSARPRPPESGARITLSG